ncbi:hypothetical protein [Spirilliplanes yamanashiensis]|uniref:Uncharacterized protein n=1 Tax=Spirilliplanes yamanashiensis TaxID=42233 RepID=A0A8J4DJQ6_9ACTN|nr:hypothetical protein [Spirilliplanes yamanashiensis]MDP9815836.1 hypothetical protein [Spirilliplanes yamanashiensis]GIJ04091.1 hypothetical protein Sya03_34430 [Spirilliplanes yamanashiensis]
MRAKKLSRIIGFAFVVAVMGGIGATAWAGTDEQTPAPAPVVVETTSPAPAVNPPKPVKPKAPNAPSRIDFEWN